MSIFECVFRVYQRKQHLLSASKGIVYFFFQKKKSSFDFLKVTFDLEAGFSEEIFVRKKVVDQVRL